MQINKNQLVLHKTCNNILICCTFCAIILTVKENGGETLDKMIEKIEKLTKLFKALGKLMIEVASFLTFATLVETAIKTMFDIWFKL